MRRTLTGGSLQGPPSVDQNRRDAHSPRRGQSARSRSLLGEDPGLDVVDMATLVQIARAIEDEAVRRYEQLAKLMDDRGEPAVAEAFRAMRDEELSHVVAVDRWAAALGDPVPAAEEFEWRLPADLSSSWDDVAGSALLTPYRAFAVAVENEERAFAFYSYLAARAGDEQVRAEAEKLGVEELRHAALLRRWRRRAYHRERRSRQPGPVRIESVAMLREFLAQQEAEIAAAHLALAQRLERAGEDPRHLLVDAQKPLEALADVLEAVMATAEGELFDEAAAAMAGVIERITRISLREDDA